MGLPFDARQGRENRAQSAEKTQLIDSMVQNRAYFLQEGYDIEEVRKNSIGDIMLKIPVSGKKYCIGYRRDFSKKNLKSIFTSGVWVLDHINLFDDPTKPGRVDTSVETGNPIQVDLGELQQDLAPLELQLRDIEERVFQIQREVRKRSRRES